MSHDIDYYARYADLKPHELGFDPFADEDSYFSREASDYRKSLRRLGTRLENANIPEKHADWRWDTLSPYAKGETGLPADAIAKGWVKKFISGDVVEKDATGLLLYGEPGHGKTALSAVTLREALIGSQLESWGTTWNHPYQPSHAAHMVPYRHLLTLTQRQYNKGTTQEEDNLLLDIHGHRGTTTAIRLLVLDDVGKEHRTSSGWAAGFFEDLIRDRHYQGWPTILTTNVMPDEWVIEYGPSCASYLLEAFAKVHVAAPGGDRRAR